MDIGKWISGRLKEIPIDDYINNTRHRIYPTLKKQFVIQRAFSVPLSCGEGTALLSTPDDPAKTKNILIILLHDIYHDSSYPLWHWIHTLNDDGFSVLTIDWDGHGTPTTSSFEIQETTRSIPLILQRLYGQSGGLGLGAKRQGPLCFLMGHGLGASYALISATRLDVAEAVSGVIAVSPIIAHNDKFRFFGDIPTLFNVVAWTQDFANKFSYYGIRWLKGIFFSPSTKTFPVRTKLFIHPSEQIKRFVFEAFSERRLLRQVKTPVLWLHGRKDCSFSYENSVPLMMEIPTAFFSYHDNNRNYLRMSLSDKIQQFSSQFISSLNSSLQDQ